MEFLTMMTKNKIFQVYFQTQTPINMFMYTPGNGVAIVCIVHTLHNTHTGLDRLLRTEKPVSTCLPGLLLKTSEEFHLFLCKIHSRFSFFFLFYVSTCL